MKPFAYITFIFQSGMTHGIKLDLSNPESNRKLDLLLHTTQPVTFDTVNPAGIQNAVGENISETVTVNQTHVSLMKVIYVDEPDQSN